LAIAIYDLVKRIRGRKMAEFQGKYQLIILCNKTIIIGTLMSYARSCADAKEEVFRKLIFQKKLERFEEHNEKYRQGFGDLYSGNQQVCRYDRRRNESVHPWSGPTCPTAQTPVRNQV
jgi:hypothetical protein